MEGVGGKQEWQLDSLLWRQACPQKLIDLSEVYRVFRSAALYF